MMKAGALLDRLFVYGTLRRGSGHEMARFLALNADLLGTGYFQGRLYDLGRYPAAVPSDEPADRVVGEVYLLRDVESTIRVIDEYEGCRGDQSDQCPGHGLFSRRTATICINGDEKIAAWVYTYNRHLPGALRVLSGDYLDV